MSRGKEAASADLLARLRSVLIPEVGDISPADLGVQVALNVILGEVTSAAESSHKGPAVTTSLAFGQVIALEIPLTALLAQRIHMTQPLMSPGEVEFKATAAARLIVSTSILSLGECQQPLRRSESIFGM